MAGGAGGAAGGVRDVVLREVRKEFAGHVVLDDVSLTLEAGGRYCLMAPSGSGKTTLLRVLLGLETHDLGTIEGLSAGHVSMMFQEDRLCEVLSAVENVALVLGRDARRSEVAALLTEVLPVESLDKPVMQLSGGMRRRVSLVRAMAFPSDLVVLDEPFTGLDSATRRQVIDFVLRHLAGRTLLVATHGEDDARLLGAQVVRLAEVQGPEVRARLASAAGGKGGAGGAAGEQVRHAAGSSEAGAAGIPGPAPAPRGDLSETTTPVTPA